MSVRHVRAPFVAVAAVAIGLLVAGCGGNDASSDEVTTTSLAETTTSQSAEPSSAGTETPPADVSTPAPESPAVPAPAQPAEPAPAQPAPAPADPGAAGAPPAAPGPADDRGQAYVATLRERGMPVVDDGDLAISTANYICTAQTQGEDPQLVTTYVTAMVGSEASAAGVTLTDEQAAANAATYIEVATATYC